MKNLPQYMLILVAGVLGACGSMSVNDPYAEALPADFNPQEYMTLHPELYIYQIRDNVEAYNSQVKKNLDETSYQLNKTTDKAAFVANLDVVGLIYTHPLLGGNTQEKWASVVAGLSLPDTVPEYKSAKNEIDNLEKTYNLIGVADDFNTLFAFPIDYQAISQQFNVFGRDHGWAYRVCRPEEGANPLRSTLPIAEQQKNIVSVDGAFIADTGYYCRDAEGNDRLIQ